MIDTYIDITDCPPARELAAEVLAERARVWIAWENQRKAWGAKSLFLKNGQAVGATFYGFDPPSRRWKRVPKNSRWPKSVHIPNLRHKEGRKILGELQALPIDPEAPLSSFGPLMTLWSRFGHPGNAFCRKGEGLIARRPSLLAVGDRLVIRFPLGYSAAVADTPIRLSVITGSRELTALEFVRLAEENGFPMSY